MNHQISIVIPVLNEEAYIGKLLEHIQANGTSQNVAEIIVVDGGSTDQTPNIVKAFSETNALNNLKAFNYIGQNTPALHLKTDHINPETSSPHHHTIKLMDSAKGRAKQMNLGAKYSTGNILYFLHADSFPPKHFDQYIINSVEKGNQAGCFRMRFDSNHWWLRLASWLTQFRWRACRGGDQSQFITKSLFNAIGGFDERYIIYEDNMLINALYARGQFVVINKKLKTSARMYRNFGVWKLQYIYWSIYVKKWLGATAEELYAYYKKHMG